jgi:hypothetical protein
MLGLSGCRDDAVDAYIYPPSWPYIKLHAPQAGVQLHVPDELGGTSDKWYLDGEVRDAGQRSEHRIWRIAFNDPGLETELVEYFDDMLRPLDFQLLNAGVPKFGERIYISPDHTQQVSFKWQDSHRFFQSGEFHGYLLTVVFWIEPLTDLKAHGAIPEHDPIKD